MYKFSELVDLEKKEDLWRFKIMGIPAWYYIREEYSYSTRVVGKKSYFPNVYKVIKTLIFLLQNRKKKYDAIFCLSNRKDMLDFYFNERNNNSLLIVNRETSLHIADEHLCSDFFDVLRLALRGVCWIFYYKEYKTAIDNFESSFVKKSAVRRATKLAIGDFSYNVFLKKILPYRKNLFYSGAVIPVSEKFTNMLNSSEIQHGVIHRSHPGYVYVPFLLNELILYSDRYISILEKNGFSGRARVIRFKTAHSKISTDKCYHIVVYTQPIPEFSEAINRLADLVKEPMYLKKHPRDSYSYSKKFIELKEVHPCEVRVPVMYTSSIIEDFLVNGKQVYILDVKAKGLSLMDYLDAYPVGDYSDIKIYISENDLATDLVNIFYQERGKINVS